ncbi:MAG TPA: hypothetical protein DDX92_00015 [Flavobacteriales bacterium]|nr:hypothetical protein [Flavobacteriales bacterium]
MLVFNTYKSSLNSNINPLNWNIMNATTNYPTLKTLALIFGLIFSTTALADNSLVKNTKVKNGLYFQVLVTGYQLDDHILSQFETIEQFKSENSKFNYRLGVFANYKTAKAEAKRLRENSIPGASVLPFFNHTELTMNEAIILASDQSKYESGFSVQGQDVSVEELNSLLYNSGQGVELTYRIHMGTYPDPVSNVDYAPEAHSMETQEGFFTLVSNNFESKGEAITYRKDLLNKGCNEAYVVPYLNGKRISLLLAETISELTFSDMALNN